jgi:hypothetical protein
MVLLLFPAVAAGATGLVRTTFVVFGDEGARLPVPADVVCVIVVDIWLPPEVLPIVRVHALGLVVLFIEWAPLGLEIEHVEICVFGHFVDEAGLELLGTVREGTVVSIITFMAILGVLCAIFRLVFFWMIDTLHSIVRHLTLVLVRTLVRVLIVAKIRGIDLIH